MRSGRSLQPLGGAGKWRLMPPLINIMSHGHPRSCGPPYTVYCIYMCVYMLSCTDISIPYSINVSIPYMWLYQQSTNQAQR